MVKRSTQLVEIAFCLYVISGFLMRWLFPSWFNVYAFVALLHMVYIVWNNLTLRMRFHQIGTEVALEAIWKKMGIRDDFELEDQIKFYFSVNSPDLKRSGMPGDISGRDW